MTLDDELRAMRPDADRLAAATALRTMLERFTGRPGEQVRLGRFVLVRRIGTGAQGTVYQAHDPELDRMVALKVLAHAVGERERAETVREARAMARLSSPNVVAIYEIGTADDRCFIAMEYVEGVSLSRWLEDGRSQAEILHAFAEAGRGLAAAHRSGVIHRDFKPSNVLVGPQGRVRVTDFGLARLQRDEQGAAEVVGTPGYIAPEIHRGAIASPATDQFAFCVALRDAFALARPCRIRFGSRVPPGVAAVLRRGMHLDPARRYPSVDALVDDLLRVGARRRWLALGLGIAITAGAIALSLPDREPGVPACAEPAPSEPTLEDAPRIEAELQRYASRWVAIRRTLCTTPTAAAEPGLQCLADAKIRYDAVLSLADDPRSSHVAAAAAAIPALPPLHVCEREVEAEAFGRPPGVDERLFLPVAHKLARADVLLDAGEFEAVSDELDALAPTLDRADLGWLSASYQLARAALWTDLGDYEDAEAAARRALRGALQHRAWALALKSSVVLLELVGHRRGEPEEGARYLDLAEGLLAQVHDPRTEANVRFLVGMHSLDRDDYEAAEREFGRALELLDAAFDGKHPGRFYVVNGLARVRGRQGRYAESVALHREAVDGFSSLEIPHHPGLSIAANGLAIALYRRGEFAEAEAAARRAVAAARADVASENSDRIGVIEPLAAILLARGRTEEALALLERELELGRRLLGDQHPRLVSTWNMLAAIHIERGEFEPAIREFREALRISETTSGAATALAATLRANLGVALDRLGRDAEAIVEHERSIAIAANLPNYDHHELALTYVNLARLRRAAGDTELALSHLRAAYELGADEPGHRAHAQAAFEAADILVAQGRWLEARPYAMRAFELHAEREGPVFDRAASAFALARVLHRTGERQRAIALARTARAQLGHDPDAAGMRREIASWLRTRGG